MNPPLTVFETLLGIDELIVTNIEIDDNVIHIYCESKFAEVYCPYTLKKCNEVNQEFNRKIRDLPISGKKVMLNIKVRQFYSPHADCYFTERFRAFQRNQYQTVRYQQYIYESCKNSSLQRVVLQEDLCWKTVNSIFKKLAKRAIKQRSNIPPRALGIDEFAIKKGHKNYACVLIDLETGSIIDVLPYRDKDSLNTYFKKMGDAFCQSVEVFSCDMWDGYVAVAKIMFPNASIVIDRFHFFSHMNKALDNARKLLRRQFKDEDILKGIKWLLLKNPDRLMYKQKQDLAKVFETFPELKTVYDLKNELRDIFESDLNRQDAEKEIDQWVKKTSSINNRYTNKFLKTLGNWKDYVLNYFNERITNGIVEGINNKIKMIKRMAFGFRNFVHFRLRIIVNFD